MSARSISAIVLAAGEGTRMRSQRPKPIHLVCGRPMVSHVLSSLTGLGVDRTVVVVGHGAERVTKRIQEEALGNLNVTFDGVDGEALLVALDDVAVSSGAACTAAEPSHVLTALGLSRDRALASLRFGIGRGTTEAEVDGAAARVSAVVKQLRAMSPVGA